MNYNCNCKKFNFSDKNYSYWENRKTTSDEMEILQMLLQENDLKNKEILHIGIGNSDFAKNFYFYTNFDIIVNFTHFYKI